MQKKDLVSMFMESPFYFELTPRERLFLLKDHGRQFGRFGAAGLHDAALTAESPAPVIAAEPEQEGIHCFAILSTLPAGPEPGDYPFPGEPQIKREEP